MKRNFMWYYSVIWLSFGGLACLFDFLSYGDSDSFWGVAVVIPTLIWLFRESK